MGFFDFLKRKGAALPDGSAGKPLAPGEIPASRTTEVGTRSQDVYLAMLRHRMWVDPRLLQVIRDVRDMDKVDGRVKKIHSRCARAAAKGGLRLVASGQPQLEREFKAYRKKIGLDNAQKLQSDLRGLLTDGNLALQWVLDEDGELVAGIRMPPETLRPNTNKAGMIAEPGKAYTQVDLASGGEAANFALWQLTIGRLDPENFDDWNSPGRPYLDASRSTWRKLVMTEEDTVIRRHMRAPLRMSHILEGATTTELAEYKLRTETAQGDGNFSDYYSNKKGGVTALQGDANLEQIADIVLLLDAFLSGGPMPKGLLGYTEGLNRDILEDLKREWYDEMAAVQLIAAGVYHQGFVLWLLLRGINAAAYDFSVQFAERITDTPNQRADHALKLQALGASQETVLETAGLNATDEKAARKREAAELDPYPNPDDDDPHDTPGTDGKPRVAVTPGNGRKGESATTVSTRTKQ